MPTTLGRLKSGNLILTNEINERLPPVTNGLYRHYPFDSSYRAYFPSNIRYIKDWISGNSINTYNHWVEIQAIDYNGTNVAQGKSGSSSIGAWNPLVTDGNTATDPYYGSPVGGNTDWVIVDLGALYDIEFIKIWHYYGDGRTYRKTKTEVSDDGVNWFTIFDSIVEGEYVETSAGKTHDLKTLGTTVNPITSAGSIFDKDVLVIQDATTNLITNGNFSDGVNGWTLVPPQLGNATLTPTVFYGKTCLYNDVGYYTDTSHYMYTSSVAASTTYTVSFKVYRISGEILFDPNGKWNTGITLTPEVGEWATYSYSFTTDATAGTVDFNFYSTATSRAKYYLTDLQLEARPYATAYTETVRPSAGRVDIPFVLKPPYTVNVWHKPMMPLSYVTDQPTSPMILQWNNYYANASISLWNFVKVLRLYVKGNTAAGWTGTTSHYTYSGTTWDNVEHMYTVVAVDNRTFRVYMDGVYLGQNVNTEDVTNITYLSMGNTSMPNARYRDLSIYSRALSDSEIASTYKHAMKMETTGQLRVKKLVEEPPAMPDDVYYFPMTEDAANKYQNIKPILTSNLAFENSVMWVGAATTNLFSQTIPSTPDANVVVTEYGTSNAGNKIYKAAKTTSDALAPWASARLYVNITSGASYTISFKAKSISGEDIKSRIAIHWGGGNSAYQRVEYIGDGWYKFSGTYTLAATAVNCGVGIVGSSSPFEFIYTEVQMENQTFATPFVNGTRPYARINYTGTSITSTNWQEFTFMMWVNYQQSGVWRLSGAWSRWYFGANTSNGLSFSWLDGTQKSFASASGLIQTNTWYHIAVTIKANAQFVIYLNGAPVATRTTDINLSSTSMDFAINSFDHNSTGYPINGYIKDMIFSDRALTASEVKSIYAVQARAHKEKFYVQGIVTENQTL